MAELMAKTNQPTDSLNDAYSKWSEGGWGSILTGTVHDTTADIADQLTHSNGKATSKSTSTTSEAPSIPPSTPNTQARTKAW